MNAHERNFLRAVQDELEGSRDKAAQDLFVKITEKAKTDPDISVRLNTWAEAGSTLALRDLAVPFGDAEKDLAFFNAIHAIDAATVPARDAMPATRRTIDHTLFPLMQIGDWKISLQADKAGYQCAPKEALALLEDYASMEAVIYGPFEEPVDPATLGLPAEVIAKFTPLDPHGKAAIGCHLTWGDVDAIRAALLNPALGPNAGIPRGSIGWASREVWHGASRGDAEDIFENGIRMDASSLGYFGRAFYVADDRALSVSNYVNMNEDEDAGAVLRGVISADAKILDLRNARDWAAWQPLAPKVSQPDFDVIARRAGVDGVYDRSVGGLALFNAKAIEIRDIEILSEPEEDAFRP